MADGTFGTTVNCIDGRVQEPVAAWVKTQFGVDYVDTVTAPGPDGVLTQGAPAAVALIRDYIHVSQQAHGSAVVAVAGHQGCAGFPVSPDEHLKAIRAAATTLASWGLPMRVIGLWVSDSGQVRVICDSAGATDGA